MRRRLVVLSLLAGVPGLCFAEEPCAPVKPCEIGEAQAAKEEEPADLLAEARQLYEVVACQGKVPEGLDSATVKAFCDHLRPIIARHEAQVRNPLTALMAQQKPARVPSAVLYPFADADLLSALEAFPEARNITTISPEPAGDPQALSRLQAPANLRAALDRLAIDAERLLRGESRARAKEPQGILPLLLWALALEGNEPAGLRFFRVEPAGTLRYLGRSELAVATSNGGQGPFSGCELSYVRRDSPAGPAHWVRHLEATLSDSEVTADAGPMAYLSSKGDVSVLLRRASALAGDDFTRLRGLLMRRGAYVVSDGTGLSEKQILEAGLTRYSRPRPGGGPPIWISRRP